MVRVILFVIILVIFVPPCYGEVYRWVDEKGTVHFSDDLSKIPEKYRPDAELRKAPREVPAPEIKEKPAAPPDPKVSESEGFEVNLFRRYELLLVEVLLNGKVRKHFIVDTGASFTLINQQTVRELGITIDENTPVIRSVSVSDVILTPLVTLKSIQVGKAEVENVETLVYTMPTYQGLLGNSFLNKFKVVIDANNAKMTLFSMQGTPSPDRPGGYGRDYWMGQFRFYHRNLEELKN